MTNDKKSGSYPFRRTLQAVSGGSTYEYLNSDPVGAGEVWAVEGVTVLDDANNIDACIVYVGPYGLERPVSHTQELSDGQPYRFTDGFYVSDGERVRVRFQGSASSDVLTAIIEGEVHYVKGARVPLEVSG